MNDQSPDPASDERDVNRRAMLRRGGVIVAATVAGVAAVDGLTAGSARAASGDPLLVGTANDSGTDPTTLTSAATSGPTLSLENSATNAPFGLASAQSLDTFAPDAAGELARLDNDVLYYTFDFGPPVGIQPAFVYTEWTATQVQTIVPQRALDTRSGAGRANILNPSGNLDSSGRLLGGHTINIDMSNYEFGATTAFCNLTVVAATATGYMILFPGGSRPATSSIDFLKGQTLANFAVTGTTSTLTQDSVSIFSSVTSHVLLDVTAFCVFSVQQINTPFVAGASAGQQARVAARVKAGTTPDWFRSR